MRYNLSYLWLCAGPQLLLQGQKHNGSVFDNILNYAFDLKYFFLSDMSDTSRPPTDKGFNIFRDCNFWTLPKECTRSLRSLIEATIFSVTEISVITA